MFAGVRRRILRRLFCCGGGRQAGDPRGGSVEQPGRPWPGCSSWRRPFGQQHPAGDSRSAMRSIRRRSARDRPCSRPDDERLVLLWRTLIALATSTVSLVTNAIAVGPANSLSRPRSGLRRRTLPGPACSWRRCRWRCRASRRRSFRRWPGYGQAGTGDDGGRRGLNCLGDVGNRGGLVSLGHTCPPGGGDRVHRLKNVGRAERRTPGADGAGRKKPPTGRSGGARPPCGPG